MRGEVVLSKKSINQGWAVPYSNVDNFILFFRVIIILCSCEDGIIITSVVNLKQNVVDVTDALNLSSVYSRENFVNHPLDDREWVDGQIIEKTGMTVKHGVIQGRLSYY